MQQITLTQKKLACIAAAALVLAFVAFGAACGRSDAPEASAPAPVQSEAQSAPLEPAAGGQAAAPAYSTRAEACLVYGEVADAWRELASDADAAALSALSGDDGRIAPDYAQLAESARTGAESAKDGLEAAYGEGDFEFGNDFVEVNEELIVLAEEADVRAVQAAGVGSDQGLLAAEAWVLRGMADALRDAITRIEERCGL